MEPLAAWVRMDALIVGFEWTHGLSDRIALYSDDVLFFFTQINRSGPRLLRILEIFGENWAMYEPTQIYPVDHLPSTPS